MLSQGERFMQMVESELVNLAMPCWGNADQVDLAKVLATGDWIDMRREKGTRVQHTPSNDSNSSEIRSPDQRHPS